MWGLSTAGCTAETFPGAWADGDQFIKEQSRRVSGMEMLNHSLMLWRGIWPYCVFLYEFFDFMFHFFCFTFNLVMCCADVANWSDLVI